MDVYEICLQRVKKLEQKRAKLYRRELAAILVMRGHAGFSDGRGRGRRRDAAASDRDAEGTVGSDE